MPSRFTILNPCQKRWEELAGDESERFCEACQKPVHALAGRSEQDIFALLRDGHGHLCGYIANEPMPPPARSRRFILVAAAITAISPMLAQNGQCKVQVKDAGGGPVVDANLAIFIAETRKVAEAKTDSAGVAVIKNLPMGNLKIVISSTGFAIATQLVTLTGAEEKTIEITLQLVRWALR